MEGLRLVVLNPVSISTIARVVIERTKFVLILSARAVPANDFDRSSSHADHPLLSNQQSNTASTRPQMFWSSSYPHHGGLKLDYWLM